MVSRRIVTSDRAPTRAKGAIAAGALCALLTLHAGAARGQDLVVRGGEVRPVSGAPIPEGVVVVRGGRVAAVGAAGSLDIPAGIEVLDAAGLIVTPGFIDANTTVARSGGGGRGGGRGQVFRPPDAFAADLLGELSVPGEFGMEAAETAAHPWVMDGVTTVYVAPPGGRLVAGFGVVVKLEANSLGEILDRAPALHVGLGDDERGGIDGPTTRQGIVAALRQWLGAARRAIEAGVDSVRLGRPFSEVEGAAEVALPISPELTAVLAGEIPIRFRAQSPDDILSAVRVAEEYGLRFVVEGAAGAHLVAEALARAGGGVVVGPAMVGSGANTPQTWARTPENAGHLVQLGITVALSTEGASGASVVMEAAVARGHGLSSDAALRALTLDAAQLLGVDNRIGSLEVGMDADLVLWSDDPTGTWAEAQAVVVGGRVVFRR